LEDAVGNIAAVRNAIEASEFDAVIATARRRTSATSSDAVISTLKTIRERFCALAQPRRAASRSSSSARSRRSCIRQSWISDIGPIRIASSADGGGTSLRELGLENARVGCAGGVPTGQAGDAASEAAFPKLKLEPAKAVPPRIGCSKTPRERKMYGRLRGTEKNDTGDLRR